jgi:transposase
MWTPADRALVGDFGSGQALTDDRFRLLDPLIPPAKPGGWPRSTDLRNLLDGLWPEQSGPYWRGAGSTRLRLWPRNAVRRRRSPNAGWSEGWYGAQRRERDRSASCSLAASSTTIRFGPDQRTPIRARGTERPHQRPDRSQHPTAPNLSL